MGERHWIEWSGGANRPVPMSVPIDIKYEDGRVLLRSTGPAKYDNVPSGSWLWRDGYIKVIAYRLSDTDDKAKREARMERFRGIAKSKEFLIEETLKPREKVK